MRNRFFYCASRFATSLFLLLATGFTPTQAAPLTNLFTSLSDTKAGASGVSYTIAFRPATTGSVKRIEFQFSTQSAGTTRPAGLVLSGATLGTVTNLDGSWDLNTDNAGTGKLALTRASAASLTSGSLSSVVFNNVHNSNYGDCDTASTDLSDTCHITISTYSDEGVTLVDDGATTYSVAIDPELSFAIEGVNSGQTHNGITTDITTTPTAFPFGTLVTDQPHHAAHKLTITTNAPHGYKVFSYLADPITGSYGSTEISPFGATNATWNTPQTWMAPTGTVAGSNTGWFGANTTDVRIPGWSSAANKFGPISTVPHIVAESSGPDPSGSVIYVTYVLGVNGVQTSDIYIGNLLYDIQPTY